MRVLTMLLPEKTYKTVADALDVAVDAMRKAGPLGDDFDDLGIYLLLLHTVRRVCKRGRLAQKSERGLRRGLSKGND